MSGTSTLTTPLHGKSRKASRSRTSTTKPVSTNSTIAIPGHAPQMPEHQCCGVVEETTLQIQENRENRGRQFWIVQKLVVLIVLGIMGYTGYVYIGKFCLSSIHHSRRAVTGRPTAIVLLVIFCILYFWMVWAYVKVVLTSPGYAKDHVPRTSQPFFDPIPPQQPDYDAENALSHYNSKLNSPHSTNDFDPTQTRVFMKRLPSSSSSREPHGDDVAGPPYEDVVRTSMPQQQNLKERHLRCISDTERDDGGVGEGRMRSPDDPPFSTYLSPTPVETTEQDENPEGQGQVLHAVEMVRMDGHELPPKQRQRQDQTGLASVPSPPPTTETTRHKDCRKRNLAQVIFLPVMWCSSQKVARDTTGRLPVQRRPPMIPVLHPVHRYCHRDFIVRPHRAHHCRSCGTCVLKFDHHCPWIGQCVGARNHKFFINFCLATGVFAPYVLGTLLGFNVSGWTSASSFSSLDPEIIVVCALAFLFALFTITLSCSHILLILKGQTTVESVQMHAMKHRESVALTNAFGFCAFSVKRDVIREWTEEWGDLDTEGNLWWTGSRKQSWVDVMGRNPLGWIFPIGRSLGDGLTYPVNPRFDEQGRMRRRVEWPADLR